MMGSKRAALFLVGLAGAVWQARAMGALNASAILMPQQLGPSDWRYSLTLHDTGSTAIGSFWFSWIPGENFMATAPSAISSPATWSGSPMNFGASDGHSILWSGSTPIAAGRSLSGFRFDSASSPGQLAGVRRRARAGRRGPGAAPDCSYTVAAAARELGLYLKTMEACCVSTLAAVCSR